jgi:hypothetical protein
MFFGLALGIIGANTNSSPADNPGENHPSIKKKIMPLQLIALQLIVQRLFRN